MRQKLKFIPFEIEAFFRVYLKKGIFTYVNLMTLKNPYSRGRLIIERIESKEEIKNGK